jgi:hypothetical protein
MKVREIGMWKDKKMEMVREMEIWQYREIHCNPFLVS